MTNYKNMKEEVEKQEAMPEAQQAPDRISELNSKYEALLVELESLGATDNAYDPSVDLPFKGRDLTKMINYTAEVDKMLDYFKQMISNLTQMFTVYNTTIDNMQAYNAAMVINLMEKHLELVKSGHTITSDEMDKIDAKAKIKL